MASNRLSTAIFHGIAAGCEPAVYGDPMELVGARAGFNGKSLLVATYPELHGEHTDVDVAREIGHRELGQDFVMEPAELTEAAGWGIRA